MDRKVDLISSPKKSFWKLSIPIIGFAIFDALYGIIDMYWISKMSHDAYFAIGVAMPLFTLIVSFGDSIGQGTNSIMSRYIGFGDYEKSYNSLLHGILVSFIVWGLIVLCIFFLTNILTLMDVTKSTDLVMIYLTPLFSCSIVFLLSNLFAETFQAEGDSKIPTVLMIATNILNMALDPVFIFTFNMGVVGAAVATILSSAVSMIVFAYIYLSDRAKIPLKMKYFEFTPHIIFEITKVAIPNFLDNAMWCFSAVFINKILMSNLGTFGIILYSSSGKIKDLLSAPIKGYGRGLMSVTGHLFGARKIDELEEMYSYVLKWSIVTSLILAFLFLNFSQTLFSLFSVSNENSIFVISVLGFLILVSIPFAIISSKMLDGFGKSYYSLVLTALKIAMEFIIIPKLDSSLPLGSSILIGVTVSEMILAVIYFVLLKVLFWRFRKNGESIAVV